MSLFLFFLFLSLVLSFFNLGFFLLFCLLPSPSSVISFFPCSFFQHVLAFSGHALPHIFADVRQINRASASHTCSARNIRLFEQEDIVPFELFFLSFFLYITSRNFLSFFVSWFCVFFSLLVLSSYHDLIYWLKNLFLKRI